MNSHKSALSLLKEFLTKSIFTVGLCTTAYYSVVKAHNTFFTSQASVQGLAGEPPSLRDKVDIIDQSQNLGTVPQAQFAEAAKSNLNKIVETPEPAATPQNNMIIQAAVETAANASPSPTPPTEALPQEEVAQNPYPQQYYPYGYNPYAQNGDGSTSDGSSKDKKDSRSPSSDSDQATQYGIGGQLIIPPKPTVVGGVNIAAGGNTTNVTSNLTTQDIQWLTSLGIKATIETTAEFDVSGHNQAGAAVTGYKASASWWNFDRGFDVGSSFTVRPNTSGGGAPVQIDVMIQTKDLNGTQLPISFSLRPTDSNARNDVINGKAVRVYTLRAPDQAVNNNHDTLTGIVVSLVVEQNGATPVLTGGTLLFNRAEVKVSHIPWAIPRDPGTANDWVIADQLPFSMKLEKSP